MSLILNKLGKCDNDSWGRWSRCLINILITTMCQIDTCCSIQESENKWYCIDARERVKIGWTFLPQNNHFVTADNIFSFSKSILHKILCSKYRIKSYTNFTVKLMVPSINNNDDSCNSGLCVNKDEEKERDKNKWKKMKTSLVRRRNSIKNSKGI